MWEEPIPTDTLVSNAEVLASQAFGDTFPGRAMPAYDRALDWLLASDRTLVRAA